MGNWVKIEKGRNYYGKDGRAGQFKTAKSIFWTCHDGKLCRFHIRTEFAALYLQIIFRFYFGSIVKSIMIEYVENMLKSGE